MEKFMFFDEAYASGFVWNSVYLACHIFISVSTLVGARLPIVGFIVEEVQEITFAGWNWQHQKDGVNL